MQWFTISSLITLFIDNHCVQILFELINCAYMCACACTCASVHAHTCVCVCVCFCFWMLCMIVYLCFFLCVCGYLHVACFSLIKLYSDMSLWVSINSLLLLLFWSLELFWTRQEEDYNVKMTFCGNESVTVVNVVVHRFDFSYIYQQHGWTMISVTVQILQMNPERLHAPVEGIHSS